MKILSFTAPTLVHNLFSYELRFVSKATIFTSQLTMESD